jgi:hypothetical protein
MTYARMSHLAIVAAALALAAPSQLMAQAQSPAAPQQTPGAARTFSDQKLKTYATAALEVRAIRQSHAAQLKAAKTPQEQSAIEGASMNKQVEAVGQTGLSVNEYNDITSAMQANDEIANKVKTYMSQAAQ